jgi:hypothetical protein
MLRPNQECRVPYNSIARVLDAAEETKNTRLMNTMIKRFMENMHNAITEPSPEMEEFFANNPDVPILASSILDDLESPDEIGYLSFDFFVEPDGPMFSAAATECEISPELFAKIVTIKINAGHSLNRVWTHSRPPAENIIRIGLMSLSITANTLQLELKQEGTVVLTRANYPPLSE